MQSFDIPIRFDLLDKVARSTSSGTTEVIEAYKALKPTGAFAPFSPKGSFIESALSSLPSSHHLRNEFSQRDFIGYVMAKTNGDRSINVSFTIMIDTSNLAPTDSLGVFGLRIVPDVYY